MPLTTSDQLSELIRASFPVQPLPRHFFIDGGEQPCGDIPDELLVRLLHRRWVDVTMYDWSMIGPGCIAKQYLHPDAFHYYLPSLLVGVLEDTGYLDWAPECLLPAGRKRRTNRTEWAEFWDGLSGEQRDAICSYQNGVRSMLGRSTGPIGQYLFDELEAIRGPL
jgi:hypothetical protein